MQKEKKETKIQKKLQRPGGVTLGELLAEEGFVQCFRAGNQALHNYLKRAEFQELVDLVSTVGPEDDRLRGYKLPFVACEMLTSYHAKVPEMLFLDNHALLLRLLDYFSHTQPNYVLSGYVTRILNQLYAHEPVRIQGLLATNDVVSKMVRYVGSRSVAQFLVKFIVVDTQLLMNVNQKYRRDILNQLITVYEKNSLPPEDMGEVFFILSEAIGRLWTHKHKELAKFSSEIMRVIELIIQKNGLHQQETFVLLFVKHLNGYLDAAPALAKLMLKKIFRQLSSSNTSLETLKNSNQQLVPRFGMKNLRLLQALGIAFIHFQSLIESLLSSCNFFGLLLTLMARHEWNNMLQVEIEKMFKETVRSNSVQIFKALFRRAGFIEAVRELIKKESIGKNGSRGYTGNLTAVLRAMQEAVDKGTPFGEYVKKEESRFLQTLTRYLTPKEQHYALDLAGFRVAKSYAQPQYEGSEDLLQKYRQFLSQSNCAVLLEHEFLSERSPKSRVQEQVLEEMEDQSQINNAWSLKQSSEDKDAQIDL